MAQRLNKAENWFFVKVDKINKFLEARIKEKRAKIYKIGNETGNIITEM